MQPELEVLLDVNSLRALCVCCRSYITPVDSALIPTGEFEAVDGTVFNLNNATLLNDTVTKVGSLCTRSPSSCELSALPPCEVSAPSELSSLHYEPSWYLSRYILEQLSRLLLPKSKYICYIILAYIAVLNVSVCCAGHRVPCRL